MRRHRENLSPRSEGCNVTAEALTSPKKRILIMDDDDIVLETVGSMLRYLGLDVGLALEGDEALSLYKKGKKFGTPFDVVLLDLFVEHGIGAKMLVKKLRRLNPLVKTIVVSCDVGDPIMTDYSQFGFDGVVAKPYGLVELRNAIASLIRW